MPPKRTWPDEISDEPAVTPNRSTRESKKCNEYALTQQKCCTCAHPDLLGYNQNKDVVDVM